MGNCTIALMDAKTNISKFQFDLIIRGTLNIPYIPVPGYEIIYLQNTPSV
jgi:hypothetical protein